MKKYVKANVDNYNNHFNDRYRDWYEFTNVVIDSMSKAPDAYADENSFVANVISLATNWKYILLYAKAWKEDPAELLSDVEDNLDLIADYAREGYRELTGGHDKEVSYE